MFVSPAEVKRDYEAFIEAAEILGRPDLARALRTRVTPEFCEKYAPVLKTLLLCSRNALNRPLPSFQEPIASTHVEEEIAFPEFEMYAGGDTDTESSETYSVFTASENFDADSEGLQESVQSTSESERSAEQSPLERKIRAAPAVLSYSQFVRELSLLVQGRPCYRNAPLVGVSEVCQRSLWDQFSKFESAKPRPHSSSSIIRLLAYAEAEDKDESSKSEFTVRIEKWLAGCILGWPLTIDALRRMCPHELLSPDLFDACCYAVLARKVYGAEIPHRPWSPSPYAARQARLRNGRILLDSGLRACLLGVWQRLADVFLAQDARMLVFLDLFNESPAVSANTLLQQCWPSAPFAFAKDLVPELILRVPAPLIDVFGANLENLFPATVLVEHWHKAIRGFCDGDQMVEFEMAEIAAAIKRRIETQAVPQNYMCA